MTNKQAVYKKINHCELSLRGSNDNSPALLLTPTRTVSFPVNLPESDLVQFKIQLMHEEVCATTYGECMISFLRKFANDVELFLKLKHDIEFNTEEGSLSLILRYIDCNMCAVGVKTSSPFGGWGELQESELSKLMSDYSPFKLEIWYYTRVSAVFKLSEEMKLMVNSISNEK